MKANILRLLSAFFLTSLAVQAGGEGWHTDFDAAQELAQKEGKRMLVEFHGSDWCPPCIKMNKEILPTKAFKDATKDHFVLVDLDFPRKSETPEANKELARKYGIEGFPTVLILDANGEVLAKTVGYPRGGLDEFIQFVKSNQES